MLEFLHVYRVDTFLTFFGVELYFVVLLDLDTIEAGNVNKKILVGGFFCDKAVAFGFVEEFNSPCFHKNLKIERMNDSVNIGLLYKKQTLFINF